MDIKRRGVMLAAVTAVAVLAVLLVQSILFGVAAVLAGLGYVGIARHLPFRPRAAVGTGVTFVVSLIAAFGSAIAAGGTFAMFGTSFPLARVGEGIRQAFLIGGQTAAVTFITSVPLVALAGVGLWVWVREREPSYPVEGALDL